MLWSYNPKLVNSTYDKQPAAQATTSGPDTKVPTTPSRADGAPAEFSWYDPAKLAAAQAAQGKGADGRSVLDQRTLQSILSNIDTRNLTAVARPTGINDPIMQEQNGISGVTDYGYYQMQRNGTDVGGGAFDPATKTWVGYGFTGPNGATLSYNEDGTLKGRFNNPTGTTGHDFVDATYKLDPATGQYVPAGGKNTYEGSNWVDSGRDTAIIGGTVLSAGALGAYGLGGAAAEGGGATAAGGFAPATNAALAESAVGTAGYGASSAGLGGGAGLTASGGVASAVGSNGSAAGTPAATAGQAASTASTANTAGLTADQVAYGALEEGGAAAGMGGNATAAGTYGTAGTGYTSAQVAAAKAAVAAGNGASASLVPGISNADLLKTAVSVGGAVAANNASGNALDAANNAQNAQNANAQTAQDIAREQLGLAREQYNDAKTRQAQFDPKFLAAIDAQLASQKVQDERSAQQWKQYVDYFMPAEQKLATSAMNYDTPGRRAEAEAEARAAVGAEAANGRMAQSRALDRAGVKLDSGTALTLDNASRLQEAKATGAAGIGARKQTELTGLSLVDNVAKTGRGITSTGLQAAGLGVSAGSAATGGLGTQQNTYNSSLQPASNLYAGGLSALGQSTNAYGQIIDNSLRQQQIYNAAAAGLGSLAGQLFTSKEGG